MKAVINGILLLILSVAVHAQAGVNVHSPLRIPAEHMRLDSLLNLVSRQTGARFSLNTRKIQPGKDIRLKKGATTVGALLAHIQQRTGVHYILRGAHVIFLDNPPKPKPHQQKNKDTIALRPASAPQPLELAPVHSMVATSISLKQQVPIRAVAFYPVAERKGKPVLKEIRHLLVARLGLNGDETFYASPTAEIGLPYLFGTVSWNSNFKISDIRYGAGTSFGVFRNWQLAFIATTGAAFTQTYDSVVINWSSKQQLYRGALLLRKELGRNWWVQFGPVLNMLKTNYYRDDKPASPRVPAALADQRFHVLRPHYTISDTYNPSSATSTKIWIGLQAGIYYNIPFFRRR